MQFEAVNEEDLSDQIDAAVALAGRGEELRRRIPEGGTNHD